MTVESIVDAMTDDDIREVFNKLGVSDAGDWVANLFSMRSMGIQITTYAERQLLAVNAIKLEERRVLNRAEWRKLTNSP